MISIDVIKQKAIDADLKVIEINFTTNLNRTGDTFSIFVYEQINKTILKLSLGTVRVL